MAEIGPINPQQLKKLREIGKHDHEFYEEMYMTSRSMNTRGVRASPGEGE